MAVEPLWTAQEFQRVGNAIATLEETLQEWAAINAIEIEDLMMNIGSSARPSKRLGLVSLFDTGDTTLQFEAIDTEIGLV
jgi:hypothetical protein